MVNSVLTLLKQHNVTITSDTPECCLDVGNNDECHAFGGKINSEFLSVMVLREMVEFNCFDGTGFHFDNMNIILILSIIHILCIGLVADICLFYIMGVLVMDH